jgi:hypothetical protein
MLDLNHLPVPTGSIRGGVRSNRGIRALLTAGRRRSHNCIPAVFPRVQSDIYWKPINFKPIKFNSVTRRTLTSVIQVG